MEGQALLSRSLIVRCFALCREAERSVDRVLGGASWTGLVAYYHEKIVGLGLTLERLVSVLPVAARTLPPPSQDEFLRDRSILLVSLGRAWGVLTAGRRKSWSFTYREVRFLAATLHTLADFLSESKRPEQQVLIQLRMDLWACQYLIEGRCHCLRELRKAARVKHFLHPEYLALIDIDDLIAEVDPGQKVI